MKLFLDSVGGGAWPFLVGGVICLVDSVNERDHDQKIEFMFLRGRVNLLFETAASQSRGGSWP